MQQGQRHEGQALRGAQQFLKAHGDGLGTVNTSEPRTQLDEAVTQLDAAVTVQGAREREIVGETNRIRSLEEDVVNHMRPISKLARAKIVSDANTAALTPSGKHLVVQHLVDAARAMGAAAQPYVDLYKASGFPEDFLTQLTAATDALAASIATRAEKRRQRSGATTSVTEALKGGRRAVHSLDAALHRHIAGNPALIEEWRVATRIVLKPGVPKGAKAAAARAAATAANPQTPETSAPTVAEAGKPVAPTTPAVPATTIAHTGAEEAPAAKQAA